MERGALDGLLVVTLEQAVAAPLASSRLADAGARVIKLERAGEGDFARGYDTYAAGHSTYFTWLNRHKQSCTVDLKAGADIALVKAMLAKADVFIQNLGPGATDRLGLGSATLRALFPRLITCDIRGFAANTPDANRKAYDLMIQAEAGLAGVTGTEASGPSRVGVSICDITTGMTAHAQILEALFKRERTGQGSAISVALFDVAAEAMNIPYIAARNGGPHARRIGLAHPSIAPYGAFQVGGGKQVVISIQNEREWVRFCATVLERPALAQDPRFDRGSARVENRAVLDPIVADIFAGLDYEAVVGRLREAKIAYANLNGVADLLTHPALRRAPLATPGGDVEVVANPIRFSDGEATFGAVPESGANTAAIRAEFAEPTLKSEAGE